MALAGLVLALGAGPGVAQVFTESPPPAAKPKPKPKVAPQPKPKAKAPVANSRQRMPATAVVPPPPRTFSDPAAYCAANPMIDQPANPYTGQPVPAWVASAAAPAGRAAAGSAVAWRCVSGRVLACYDAVGRGDCTQLDPATIPAEELVQYCSGKRNAKVSESVIRHTVPVWGCRKGKPEITGYRPGVDARGYAGEFWRDVTDLAPGNMLGSVPRSFIGNWSGPLRGKGFVFTINYTVGYQIKGGPVGSEVGFIGYYAADLQGKLQLQCGSTLILRSASAAGLVLEERLATAILQGACPVQGHVTMRIDSDRLAVEWRKKADDKLRMSTVANRLRL